MKKIPLIILALVASINSFATIGAIAGGNSVCLGSTIALSDTTAGGSWSSSNLSVAAIGLTTGIMSGLSTGTSVITYTVGAGYVTETITVNALPPDLAVNDGTYVNINGGCPIKMPVTTSGIYYELYHISSLPIAGGIGLGTGGSLSFRIVIPDFYYVKATDTVTGCSVTMSDSAEVTYDSLMPPPINGSMVICQGSNSTLSNAATGGIWSSSNTGVATIDSVLGSWNALTSGSANMTYSWSGGCRRIATVTVNPMPGLITGGLSVAVGATSTLSNAYPGGSWSSSSVSVATISSAGVLTGVSPGSATISYTLPTGCFVSKSVIVNGPTGTSVYKISNDVSLYPNPATDVITVEGGVGEIRIYDSQGKHVTTERASGEKAVVDIEGYAAGLFWIEYIQSDGDIKLLKFIKK